MEIDECAEARLREREMDCKGCMWMLIFVIGPLAFFVACGVLAVRSWALHMALRLVERENAATSQAQDAGVRAERVLDEVVRTGEPDV